MILGFLIKWLGGGLIEKALDAFTKTEDFRIKGKQIDSDTVKEAMKYYIEAQKNQNEVQKAKFTFPIFWTLSSLFVVPLALWWAMVLIDSAFNLPIVVANLPTPEIREWAGQMITFLFYTGGTVAGLRYLIGSK